MSGLRTCLVLLALTIAAVACDGDDDANPTTTPDAETPAATSTRAPTAAPSAPAGSTADVLTYVAEGSVWLADPPESPRRFADASICGASPRLAWSPDGERLACLATSTPPPRLVLWDASGQVLAQRDLQADASYYRLSWSPDGAVLAIDTGLAIAFIDASGATVGDVTGAGNAIFAAAVDLSSPQWSSDGRSFAYWAEDAAEARAFSVQDGTSTALPIEGHPLAWVLDDRAMLVAENYVPAQELAFPEYEVRLVYLDGRDDFQRRPELDRGTQFWLSPDRSTAAFHTGQPELGLALLDLPTGDVTPIDGASLNYPSEGIPPENVRFADDGASLVWADVDIAPTTVNSWAAGGAGRIATLFSIQGFAEVSPDARRITYSPSSMGGAVIRFVANVDGTAAVELPAGASSFAWRPSVD